MVFGNGENVILLGIPAEFNGVQGVLGGRRDATITMLGRFVIPVTEGFVALVINMFVILVKDVLSLDAYPLGGDGILVKRNKDITFAYQGMKRNVVISKELSMWHFVQRRKTIISKKKI